MWRHCLLPLSTLIYCNAEVWLCRKSCRVWVSESGHAPNYVWFSLFLHVNAESRTLWLCHPNDIVIFVRDLAFKTFVCSCSSRQAAGQRAFKILFWEAHTECSAWQNRCEQWTEIQTSIEITNIKLVILDGIKYFLCVLSAGLHNWCSTLASVFGSGPGCLFLFRIQLAHSFCRSFVAIVIHRGWPFVDVTCIIRCIRVHST